MHSLEMLQALNERAATAELGYAVKELPDPLLQRYEIPETIEEIYLLAAKDLEYR